MITYKECSCLKAIDVSVMLCSWGARGRPTLAATCESRSTRCSKSTKRSRCGVDVVLWSTLTFIVAEQVLPLVGPSCLGMALLQVTISSRLWNVRHVCELSIQRKL